MDCSGCYHLLMIRFSNGKEWFKWWLLIPVWVVLAVVLPLLDPDGAPGTIIRLLFNLLVLWVILKVIGGVFRYFFPD
jgi:hypothetical protein